MGPMIDHRVADAALAWRIPLPTSCHPGPPALREREFPPAREPLGKN